MALPLRIIGGRLRAKRLHAVPGTDTRPTANRVREAIFNILGTEIVGARVLDLFAGTGLLGIEALSRGALHGVFVDNHPAALAVIEKNVRACRLAASVDILRRDLGTPAGGRHLPGGPFQVVLMDPPYGRDMVAPTLARLHDTGLLADLALVVVEHSPKEALPVPHPAFDLRDQRRYGKTLVSFFCYSL